MKVIAAVLHIIIGSSGNHVTLSLDTRNDCAKVAALAANYLTHGDQVYCIDPLSKERFAEAKGQ